MKSFRIFIIAFFIAFFVAVILCLYGIYSKEQKYVDLGISLVCYMIPALIGAVIGVKKYGNKKAEAKTIRMFMILFLIAILSTVLIYNYSDNVSIAFGVCAVLGIAGVILVYSDLKKKKDKNPGNINKAQDG